MRKRYHTDAERREAHRLSEAARRARNPDAVLESNRKADAKRWKNDPDGMRKKHARQAALARKRNPESHAAAGRRWAKRFPEKVRFYSHQRRARLAGAKGTCSVVQLRARVDLYGGLCWVPGCGKAYEAIDHVIPLAKGGSNWPSNLRPICKSHNSRKKDHAATEFLRRAA